MAKPTAVFLTTDNMNYISNLLFRFFSDTYQVRLTDLITREQFYKLMEDTMIHIYKQKKIAPLSELNQLTLQQLKNHIKLTYIIPPSLPLPPIEEITPPIQEPMSPVTLSEDSDFFNKVQQLEFQRKTFQASPVPPSVSHAQASPMPPTNPHNKPSPSTLNPSSPSIYPSMIPPPIYKEVLIVSNQLEFEWNGPLPTLSDSHLRVCAWVAPFLVPWVQLNCEAPNKDTQTVTLLPDQTFGLYTIYRPPSKHFGYLKRWSLPWKLSFRIEGNISMSSTHQLILEHSV